MLNTSHKVLLAFLIALVLTGCGYVRIAGSKGKAEIVSLFRPSQRNVRASNPEQNFYVQGRIISKEAINFPLAVIAVSDDIRQDEIVDHYMMAGPAAYHLYLPPGHYRLYVFGDLNGNGRFEKQENIGAYDGTLVLDQSNEEIKGRLFIGTDIDIDIRNPLETGLDVSLRVRRDLRHHSAEGMITTLDDPIFSPKIGEIGHYKPADFNDMVQSYVYSLEGGLDKIPVIFVHGIGGTPAEWKTVVEGLDREKFHPWFFYYPTGERLDTSAEILISFMERLAAQHDRMVLTAYSMGGLVSRAALMKYKAKRRHDYVALFVTVSTPYGGIESARFAADTSPFIAPSWKDVGTESDFLKEIKGEPIPEHVKFYLLFGYGGYDVGESSDGAVPVRSQLDPVVQKEAEKVFGFNEDHAHILKSKQMIETYLLILEEAL